MFFSRKFMDQASMLPGILEGQPSITKQHWASSPGEFMTAFFFRPRPVMPPEAAMNQFIQSNVLGESHGRGESRTRPQRPWAMQCSRVPLWIVFGRVTGRLPVGSGCQSGVVQTPVIRGVPRSAFFECFERSDTKTLAPPVYQEPQGAGLQFAY